LSAYDAKRRHIAKNIDHRNEVHAAEEVLVEAGRITRTWRDWGFPNGYDETVVSLFARALISQTNGIVLTITESERMGGETITPFLDSIDRLVRTTGRTAAMLSADLARDIEYRKSRADEDVLNEGDKAKTENIIVALKSVDGEAEAESSSISVRKGPARGIRRNPDVVSGSPATAMSAAISGETVVHSSSPLQELSPRFARVPNRPGGGGKQTDKAVEAMKGWLEDGMRLDELRRMSDRELIKKAGFSKDTVRKAVHRVLAEFQAEADSAARPKKTDTDQKKPISPS
jgi:hypothetical protein